MDLLLLSNSTNHESSFLAHAREEIATVAAGRKICFVPFALAEWDEYVSRVQAALSDCEVVGAHQGDGPFRQLLEAECVFVGGGNTFRLLDSMRRFGLLELLASRVRSGECSYVGSSAGTNLACPTIRTTNDMPIVDPGSFAALGLVPFQINPHFTDELPPGLMAESRSERIAQFLQVNDVPVLGLFEGSWLRVRDESRVVGGKHGAVLFQRGVVEPLSCGTSLDPWWVAGVFDDQRSHQE